MDGCCTGPDRPKMVTQVLFSRGTMRTVGWVRADGRLRPGAVADLDGVPWKVEEVYVTMPRRLIRTDWLVGGNTRHDR